MSQAATSFRAWRFKVLAHYELAAGELEPQQQHNQLIDPATPTSITAAGTSIHTCLLIPHIFVMPATTAETLSLVTRNVSVAPLVLLSAADHYGRQAKGTRNRVVGVLLGQNDGKNVRVSNSFAGTCATTPRQLVCRRTCTIAEIHVSLYIQDTS